MVLPGSEVEEVGPAVEVVRGADVLAVEENLRFLWRDVGLDDRVSAGARGHAHARVTVTVSIAVIARHDGDSRSSPPPRRVVRIPAQAPTVRVVTPSASAKATVVPATAAPTAAAAHTAEVRAACPASAPRAAHATRVARPRGLAAAAMSGTAVPGIAAGLRCPRRECHRHREGSRHDQGGAKEARRRVRDHVETPGRDFVPVPWTALQGPCPKPTARPSPVPDTIIR